MMPSVGRGFFILLISCFIALVSSVDNTTPKTGTNPIKPVYARVKQSEGFTATLKCIISTKDVTEINWTRNGTQVKGDQRHTVVKSSNNTFRSTSLKIKSIEAGDYGTYECNVKISGKPYSASIKLLDKKSASAVRPNETKIKASLNSDASLRCFLPKGATSLNWLKNGTQLKTDKRHEILRSSTNKFRTTTLNIKSLKDGDFGTYECTGNISGKILSTNITLVEKKKTPPVKTSQKDVATVLKSNVILKCDFSASPSSITWLKNGTIVKSDTRLTVVKYSKKDKVTATTLNIKEVQADDYGTYECEAVISGEKQSATIKLVEKKA